MRRPNMKSAFVPIVVSLALTLLLAHAALSWQVSYGLQPFGSFSGGPFDIVNNQDLNVHFAIPVLNKAGRGLPSTIAMVTTARSGRFKTRLGLLQTSGDGPSVVL